MVEKALTRYKVIGLFAQFYYHDVNTPEYCRYYSREGHAFKTPGKVCLDVNGEWEVR